jgi:Secretion system C-terminal sorting domain
MIKKLLVAVLLMASAGLSKSYAQGAGTCNPDISCMNDDAGGGRICPVGLGAVDQTGARVYDLNGKSPGIDTAFIGVPYSSTVSLKIPTTNAGQPANNNNAQGTSSQVIDWVYIYAFDNMPPGTTYECMGGGVTGPACGSFGFTGATAAEPCRFQHGVTGCVRSFGTPDQLWDKRVRTHICGRGSDLGIAVNQDRYNDNFQAVVRCAKATLSGSQTICAGGTATLNVLLNGKAPFTLKWSDGTNTGTVSNILSGPQTNAPYTFTVSPTITSGTATYTITSLSSYSCTATKADEMAGLAKVTVTASPAASLIPTVTATSSTSSVCDGSPVTLNYGGNATKYVWAGSVVNNQAFVPTQTATYSVTGTALNGCSKTATTTVNWNAKPTVTATAPATVCQGASVTLSGSGASTYAWDKNVVNGTAFSAAAGTVTYSVTGTDAFGCTNGTTTSITSNVSGTVTAPASYTACHNEVKAATTYSTSATTYSWTNSNAAIGLAASGTGEVPSFTATNTTSAAISGVVSIIPTLNSCPGTAGTYTITVNPLPTATISGDASICSGSGSPISIALTGVSPFNFTYGSAAGTSPVTGISSATYTVAATAGTYTLSTVTDAKGCVGTKSGIATIVENAPIATSNLITTACSSGNYTVEFDITGGNSASYKVNGVSSGSHYISASISSGTTYSFTVTDANNCNSVSLSGSKNCSCAASAIMSGGSSFCPGGSSSITVTFTGTAPYGFSYSIDGGTAISKTNVSSPYTFTTSTVGAYTLVSMNDGTCTGSTSGSATVTQKLPTATISGSSTVCTGGSVNLNFAFTGTGPWNFVYTTNGSNPVSLSSAISSKVVSVSTSGTYSLSSVSDASCAGTVSGSAVVNFNALPVITVNSATICAGQATTLAASGAVTYTWSNNKAGDTVSVSPSITKTYTVTGTDANSCIGTAEASVEVNALPTITTVATPSSAVVCAGKSVILSGAGATTYTFLGGDGSVTDGASFIPTATTTYTVIGTDDNNCSSKTTRVVTVNAVPAMGITVTPSSSICSGTKIILTATGAALYSWSDNVSNGIEFTPSGTKTYTVTGTGTNTCTSKATKLVTVSACNGVGVNEFVAAVEEITIYPNPTTGSFNIVVTNASFTQLTISVFDITGKEVFSATDKNISGDYKRKIDLENLTSGMYYVRLFTGSDVKTKKLIVQ